MQRVPTSARAQQEMNNSPKRGKTRGHSDDFAPGSIVVCSNDVFPAESQLWKLRIPRRHEVYTVRSVCHRLNRRIGQKECRLLLEEIWNIPDEQSGREQDWEAERFDLVPQDTPCTHRNTVDPLFLAKFQEERAQARTQEQLENALLWSHRVTRGLPVRTRIAAQSTEMESTLPGLMELAHTNAVLAWMVLHCDEFDGGDPATRLERARRYCMMKRHKICSALGVPSQPRFVKILERGHRLLDGLRPQDTIQKLIGLFRHPSPLLRCPALVNALTPLDIELAAAFTPVKKADHLPWLSKLGVASCDSGFEEYWLQMAQVWLGTESQTVRALLGPLKKPASFPKRATAMHYYHRRILIGHDVQEVLNAEWDQDESRDWPQPPLAPAAGIEPITSLESLREEGETMQHCVATYALSILKGICYVYRVTQPKRATLCLQWSEDGWLIDELRGIGNEALRDGATLQQAHDWLQNHPDRFRAPQLSQSLRQVLQLSGVSF